MERKELVTVHITPEYLELIARAVACLREELVDIVTGIIESNDKDLTPIERLIAVDAYDKEIEDVEQLEKCVIKSIATVKHHRQKREAERRVVDDKDKKAAESRRFFNWLHGWYMQASSEDHEAWKHLFEEHYQEEGSQYLRDELLKHSDACIDGMEAAWPLTGYHYLNTKKGA